VEERCAITLLFRPH